MITSTTRKPKPMTRRRRDAAAGDEAPVLRSHEFHRVPLSLIDTHPRNPRADFPKEEIEDLAESLRQHDLIAPIVLRPHPQEKGRYELVAGERRIRAARAAGWDSIPAAVRELDNAQAMEVMLVENLKRKDLNPIETGRALQTLCRPPAEHGAGLTHGDAGKLFGHSESWVSNLIRLLQLPKAWQERVISGEIEQTKARLLLAYVGKPRIMSAIYEDYLINAWRWQTREDFESSAKIIAAQEHLQGPKPVNQQRSPAGASTAAVGTPAGHASADRSGAPADGRADVRAWRHKFLRWCAAARLKGDSWQFAKLLLYLAAEKPAGGPHLAVDDAVRKAGGRVRRGNPWATLGTLPLAELGRAAVNAVTSLVWNEHKLPDLDPEVAEGLASDLGVDLEEAWQDAQRNRQGRRHVEEFYRLHTDAQLRNLAKELGVKLVGDKTKAQIVKALLAAPGRGRVLALPRALDQPRPRKPR